MPDAPLLAYPYGRHDEAVRRAAIEAGYALAFTTQVGRNGAGTDRWCLHRVGIHARDGFRRSYGRRSRASRRRSFGSAGSSVAKGAGSTGSGEAPPRMQRDRHRRWRPSSLFDSLPATRRSDGMSPKSS